MMREQVDQLLPTLEFDENKIKLETKPQPSNSKCNAKQTKIFTVKLKKPLGPPTFDVRVTQPLMEEKRKIVKTTDDIY